MPDQLTSLYERASIAASAPDIPEETSDEIESLWEEVHSGVDVTNEAAFGPFLARFIRERHRETPAEERQERLCRSGNHLCNCLHGELPTALRSPHSRFGRSRITADDARDYVAENGKCVVVADAIEAWDERVSETKQTLQRIIKLSRASSGGPEIDGTNIPGETDA